MTEAEKNLRESADKLKKATDYHRALVKNYKETIDELKKLRKLQIKDPQKFNKNMKNEMDLQRVAHNSKISWAELTRVADLRQGLSKIVRMWIERTKEDRKITKQKNKEAQQIQAIQEKEEKTLKKLNKNPKETATMRNARLALMFISEDQEYTPKSLVAFMNKNKVSGGQAYNAIKAMVEQKSGKEIGLSKAKQAKANTKDIRQEVYAMTLNEMREFASDKSAGGSDRWEMMKVIKEAIFKHNKFATSAPLGDYKSIKQEAYHWK